jgi:hypothetical protein
VSDDEVFELRPRKRTVHVGVVTCRSCGQPLIAHDRDDIGAGLVQYSCPEPEKP